MSKLGHYDNHPAYRYQSVCVFSDLKFGRDRETPPNIEGEFARGGPWFTGGNPITLFDEGVNPVGAIFEPLTDDVVGAGLAETDLHQASFETLRTQLVNSGFRISIDQGDQTDMRSYLASVLELFDGFLYRVGTQVGAGHWAQGAIDTSTLPVVGSTDLYSEPRVKSTGWDDAITEVNVVFRDREHYFHDTPAAVRNPGLFQALGEFRTVTLQTKFIIDATMANTYATQYLQRYARPGMSGEIDVKLEKVEAMEDAAGRPIIGQLIKTDVASLGFELIFRVTECEYPGDDGPFFCTLTVELERSIWPTIFVQPPPGRIGNFVVDVPNIANHKIDELPSGLKTASALQIAILAQRPGKSILGFHVWVSTDNVTYVEAGLPCVFGPYGILNVAYPNTTATDDTTGMQVKLLGVDMLPALTRADKLNNRMLCFLDGEILSIGAWSALGAGIYKVPTLRALYGTTKATHAINAKAYFILQSDLVQISNRNFAVGSTFWFKLQPFDTHQDFDLASVTPFSYLFVGGAVSTPTGLALTTNYVITSENRVDSRITATWNFIADQDVAGFNVRIRKFTFDSTWVTSLADLSATQTFKGLEPNVNYEVQVQAFNPKGEPSAWSSSVQKVTAAPAVPGAPTGFVIIKGVQSATLKWTNATSPGIAGTQILFSEVLGDDAHLVVIDEVAVGVTSYTRSLPYAASFVFFAVRHINSYVDLSGNKISGPRTSALAIDPLVEAPVLKSATPFIGVLASESKFTGTADFRVQIVDTTPGQTAGVYYSFDGITYSLYSTTGNYKSPGTGSVLPTGNVGAISMAASDRLFAYAIQDGYLRSDITQFWNNSTSSPAPDGGGGTGGGGGLRPPATRTPP